MKAIQVTLILFAVSVIFQYETHSGKWLAYNYIIQYV